MKPSTLLSFLRRYAPALILVAVMAACATPPDYPVEPFIEFESLSKDTLRRGSFFNDTTFVTFSFTDGDGDIGSDDSLQLFITDSRNGFINDFRIPYVLELGAANGIKGKITVQLFTSCCIFPPELYLDGCLDETPQLLYDEVIYSLYIKDRSGNESNTIETAPVYIRCFN